ncbi:DEAD/DEAH box helicase [Pseudoalteromonas sp. DL2-H2.2]|uniref:DEAD/DEAH box helicase n=1 Tax=Pseudoalteromonas sp. DL2-H2.2 TaxID=2908889 RepID=UPI001F2AE7A9|nr:DEAD/DEAH box helicase [Pseudoalteromonas sp. DL2-H2.2]MCF2910032.1 DEAD/DEAH box helicase [Pseudoalteromonas sp. DL2-H2.2]
MHYTPFSQTQITELLTLYAQLPAEQQVMLEVLALIGKPVAISRLKRLLKLLVDAQVHELPALCQGMLAQQRTALVEAGLLISNQKGLRVAPLIEVSLCYNALRQDRFISTLNCAEQVVPIINLYEWERDFADEQRFIRDLLILGQYDKATALLSFHKNPQYLDHNTNQVLINTLFFPADVDRLAELPPQLLYQACATLFHSLQSDCQNNFAALKLIEQLCERQPDNQQLHCLLAEQYLYRAQLDACISALGDDTSCYALQLRAIVAMCSGEQQTALTLFEQAIVAKNKIARRKQQYLGGLPGLFHKLAVLIQASQGQPQLFSTVRELVRTESADRKAPTFNYAILNLLEYLAECLNDGQSFSEQYQDYEVLRNTQPFHFALLQLLTALATHWTGARVHAARLSRLSEACTTFTSMQQPLFACMGADLLVLNQAPVPPLAQRLVLNFAAMVEQKSDWELALEKLQNLSPAATATAEKSSQSHRLIWQLEQSRFELTLKPREQKLGKNGWSKGRNVALKRLIDEPEQFDYLNDKDKEIIAAIRVYENHSYYGGRTFELEGASALSAAAGAHNLYLGDDFSREIELTEYPAELQIRDNGDELLISIPNLPQGIDYRLQLDEHTRAGEYAFYPLQGHRYGFTLFTRQHLQVAGIIGESGLVVPKAAKSKLLASITAIAPLLNIQSDLEGVETGLTTVEAAEELVINITPYQGGLEFHCVSMPFGDQGPMLHPGIGSPSLTTEIDGQRVATQRDLAQEQGLLELLDEHCPAFLAMADNRLQLDDTEMALEALEQLEHCVATPPAGFTLRLRWPKGKKFRLSKALESQHLALAMTKQNQWFDVTGELQVDDAQVIELKKLLSLMATSNGRFVSLDGEQILALSQDLRSQLAKLNEVTDQGQFHPLASGLVAEATTGMRMKTLPAWEEQSKKMHQANTLALSVPSTLQAQLRDYQLAGFDWAMRLAHWGAGACLADDMGLGKTLQALAVILARASEGPTLIIAPTSVCFNWQQEASKFAPVLNMTLFSDHSSSQEREQLLAQAGPFDCVVISYGLLQRQAELLKSKHWHTIVADEAQALKNPLAKRTVAACALKGEFKMITTGTPIENNLTELWSLFRFVNPGLLGNLKRFNARFAQPMENAEQDKLAAHKARQSLKQLVKPFILRRLKSQVLTELPEKTEINLTVSLSDDEMAFYEALRQHAIEQITESASTSSAAEQRIKMLAQLTKLRQACCHPKLVMAESTLPSSKLDALSELLDELRQNNHKALIFSQFVGHLQIIKTLLEQRGVTYQYLDGSTPAAQRQERVNAFQRGNGEVFLISLKAGGSGLNLTAADYVIHMDPWWNPAVEAQASDRAHRMGQQRPVTIYRLIAKNTIEEKIVALHQHKRDLADQLLAGNEQASKLSVEDMLNLLKETF